MSNEGNSWLSEKPLSYCNYNLNYKIRKINTTRLQLCLLTGMTKVAIDCLFYSAKSELGILYLLVLSKISQSLTDSEL